MHINKIYILFSVLYLFYDNVVKAEVMNFAEEWSCPQTSKQGVPQKYIRFQYLIESKELSSQDLDIESGCELANWKSIKTVVVDIYQKNKIQFLRTQEYINEKLLSTQKILLADSVCKKIGETFNKRPVLDCVVKNFGIARLIGFHN